MSHKQRTEHKMLRTMRRYWKLNFKYPPHDIKAMQAVLSLKATLGGGLIIGHIKQTRPNTMGIITGINND